MKPKQLAFKLRIDSYKTLEKIADTIIKDIESDLILMDVLKLVIKWQDTKNAIQGMVV